MAGAALPRTCDVVLRAQPRPDAQEPSRSFRRTFPVWLLGANGQAKPGALRADAQNVLAVSGRARESEGARAGLRGFAQRIAEPNQRAAAADQRLRQAREG